MVHAGMTANQFFLGVIGGLISQLGPAIQDPGTSRATDCLHVITCVIIVYSMRYIRFPYASGPAPM